LISTHSDDAEDEGAAARSGPPAIKASARIENKARRMKSRENKQLSLRSKPLLPRCRSPLRKQSSAAEHARRTSSKTFFSKISLENRSAEPGAP
jgi:hypothetical protein